MTPAEQRVIAAALRIGYLTGSEGYVGDHVILSVRLNPDEAHNWNAAVAALLAERAQQAGPAPAGEEDGA